MSTWQRRDMATNSKPVRRVKIHPYVPEQLKTDSEESYRAQVAAGKLNASSTKVQARWTELGWLVARATTARERAKLVRLFVDGKPLPFPAKDGAA